MVIGEGVKVITEEEVKGVTGEEEMVVTEEEAIKVVNREATSRNCTVVSAIRMATTSQPAEEYKTTTTESTNTKKETRTSKTTQEEAVNKDPTVHACDVAYKVTISSLASPTESPRVKNATVAAHIIETPIRAPGITIPTSATLR